MASCGGSSNGLFIVDPDDGKPRKVASGCIGEFAWSPDGDAIVVGYADERQDVEEVEVVNLQSGRTVMLDADSGQYTWSPDGSRIAYRDSQVRLWVASTTARTEPTLIWKGSLSKGSPDQPTWAPDGKYIALEAGGIHGARIALIRPDGSGFSYLTGPIADEAAPLRWFPVGSKLLFLGVVLGVPLPAPTPLWVVNIDGSGLRRLATLSLSGSSGTNYSISPDGSRVAFSYFDGSDDQIYVVNADGSGKRRLGSGDLGDWSPDGAKIVFWQSGNAYVVNAEGTGERKVVSSASASGGRPDDVASWSARGEIAYVDNVGCFSGPS